MQPRSYRLTPRQIGALDAEAERLGTTVSDTMRRIVDTWMENRKHNHEPKTQTETDRRQAGRGKAA